MNMKRVIFILLAVLFAAVLIAPAFAVGIAEGATDPAIGVTAPFSWEYLLTVTGATAATLLIVQFLKAPLDKVWKIPTRYLVYGIALAIMLAAKAFTAGLHYTDVPLILVNAFIVAVAAYGSYEITFAKLKE